MHLGWTRGGQSGQPQFAWPAWKLKVAEWIHRGGGGGDWGVVGVAAEIAVVAADVEPRLVFDDRVREVGSIDSDAIPLVPENLIVLEAIALADGLDAIAGIVAGMIARRDAISRHLDTVTAVARDHAPAHRAAIVCANAVKPVLGASAIFHEIAGGNLHSVEIVRPRGTTAHGAVEGCVDARRMVFGHDTIFDRASLADKNARQIVVASRATDDGTSLAGEDARPHRGPRR